MTFDLDKPCPHEDFQALVEVARIAKSDDDPRIVGYRAEIRVQCVACDEPFRWTGPYEVGMLADRPTVDGAGTELRAPIRPASADEDFGMGLGGFLANIGRGMSHDSEKNPGVDLSDPDDHGLLS